ncbi:MAG: hemolysin family protein [Vicinamibacterales bacterium]
MTPLVLFLLGCAAIYIGTITAAFSSLMRLSLRLQVERSGRDDLLGLYLDNPLRLFVPARVLLALIPVVAAILLARVTGVDFSRGLPLLLVSITVFVLVCEHLVPLLFIRKNPERALDLLLPSFHVVARVLQPLSLAVLSVGAPRRERSSPAEGETTEPQAPGANGGDPEATQAPSEGGEEDEEEARELLRSIVDFRETMVREVMTPRPDIVAVSADASWDDLYAVFREQQYSRVPVFKDDLDNIVGFIFVKDLIQERAADRSQPITALARAAYFVPETKKVPELLEEFQRNRVQSAIVVDEYGGTAGLVTLEDLLEEIVGEIRDEYDVEVEPVVDEGNGVFVFSGKAHVEEMANRLKVQVQGDGFETVGGYLLAHLGRVPVIGETFDVDGLAVEVLEAERRRVNRVRIQRREASADLVVESGK